MRDVPLAKIVPNPYRDLNLYPHDPEHIAELRQSINTHGFFASLKGRERDGKVELGCGHARVEAARTMKPPLETVPIFIDDIDDDTMIRLMTDENALQAGSNAAAVMNEVAAVSRRFIEGLFAVTNVTANSITRCFESAASMERARSKIRNGDAHIAIGIKTIRAYLGNGDPNKSPRGERQIREAMAALKQSGRYDKTVEEALAKHPKPVKPAPASRRAVAVKPAKPKPPRVLDERTASVFKNDHQFQAFREAVTSATARKLIPVEQQLPLAKSIVGAMGTGTQFNKKQLGAPFIKKMVQVQVEEGLKAQRRIDKEERDAYFAEQREAQIDAELHSALASVRSLLSAVAKLEKLARANPGHHKIAAFGRKLETLVAAINQFARQLR